MTQKEPKLEPPLSDEYVEALQNLGLALKFIYLRLKSEGYDIKNGEVIKTNKYEEGKNQRANITKSD